MAIARPTVAQVARKLRLSDEQIEEYELDLRDAIDEAVADVEGILNRPIIPVSQTLTGRVPFYGATDLLDGAAWSGLVDELDDDFTITAATPVVGSNPQAYDLTVMVGLDGAAEPVIVRFIKAAAVASIRNDPALPGVGTRLVTSVSADGQSVSYEKGPAGGGGRGSASAAGAGPTSDSLSRFRRHAIYRRKTFTDAPWPYSPTTVSNRQF